MNAHEHAHCHAHAGHAGHTAGHAIDPVCGMQVEKANAPATAFVGALPDRGHTADAAGGSPAGSGLSAAGAFWFCSDHCKDRFEKNPAKFAGTRSGSSGAGHCVVAEEHDAASTTPQT